jgi:hypothetical protein
MYVVEQQLKYFMVNILHLNARFNGTDYLPKVEFVVF